MHAHTYSIKIARLQVCVNATLLTCIMFKQVCVRVRVRACACASGEYMTSPCTTSWGRGSCAPCASGTFTEHSNGLHACLTCARCRPGEAVVLKQVMNTRVWVTGERVIVRRDVTVWKFHITFIVTKIITVNRIIPVLLMCWKCLFLHYFSLAI